MIRLENCLHFPTQIQKDSLTLTQTVNQMDWVMLIHLEIRLEIQMEIPMVTVKAKQTVT